MDNPLISVVVPVYLVERYLDRCLESIVNQTYKNLEIILVEDGSPDNCPQLCDQWAQKDGRIVVIHKENGGLANARNSGIDKASGEYIMFADSDDWLEPDTVEFLHKLICEYNADVSRCGFYYNFENGSPQEECEGDKAVRKPSRDEIFIELACGNHVSGVAWNKLYKTELIKTHKYNESDGCSEDIMHNYRVYCDTANAVFCDIPKYHYFIRENSITSNDKFGPGAFDIIRAKLIILEGQKNNETTLPFAIKGFVMSAFVVLSGCIQNDKFHGKKKALVDSILAYKKVILASNLYSKNDKVKTLILSVSPKLFEKMILAKHKK